VTGFQHRGTGLEGYFSGDGGLESRGWGVGVQDGSQDIKSSALLVGAGGGAGEEGRGWCGLTAGMEVGKE
jgi:hypothetical protein